MLLILIFAEALALYGQLIHAFARTKLTQHTSVASRSGDAGLWGPYTDN